MPKEQNPSLKALQQLGREMQEKIKFAPPIEFESGDYEELKDDIVKNAKAPKGEGLVEGDRDSLSEEAQRTLEKLGAAPWESDEQAEQDEDLEEDGEDEDPEEVPDEDGEEEDPEPPAESKDLANLAKKPGSKKTPVGKGPGGVRAGALLKGVNKTKSKEEKKTMKKENKPKAAKEKKVKEPRDFSKSNKAIIYTLWKKGKGETDPKKLAKAIKGEVKENTIKIWISAWGNGKNLPAIANQK